LYYFPGGRLFKGESFFECAKRKCLEEDNLTVLPQLVLDVYSTMHPDSPYDCQTHTVNIAVFALCNDQRAALDENHADYCWVDLDQVPEHAYLKDIHQKAVAFIEASPLK
jgi:ADP-ribose pyrophosphatase YjhB (NUDIX family)